jgi:hypothetical protein
MKKGIVFVALLLLFGTTGSVLAQRSSVDYPVYSNGGKPDLTIDPKRFVSQMAVIDRYFDSAGCEFQEGSVPALAIGASCDSIQSSSMAATAISSLATVRTPIIPMPIISTFPHAMVTTISRDFSVYELLTLDGNLVVAGHAGILFRRLVQVRWREEPWR